MAIGDITTTCKDCNKPFTITAKNQEWFKEMGLELPKRCNECRKARKATRQQKEGAKYDGK